MRVFDRKNILISGEIYAIGIARDKSPTQDVEAPTGLKPTESASADFHVLRSGFSRAGVMDEDIKKVY